MTVDLRSAHERLREGNFKELFIDVLAWYAPAGPAVVRHPAVTLSAVAEYAGFSVFLAQASRGVRVPASLRAPLIRESARSFESESLVIWPSTELQESLWVSCLRDAPGLPAYRLGHRELSGRMRKLLEALCFWGCNPLHFSESAVSSLVELALATESVSRQGGVPPRPATRRGLYANGHFAWGDEVASVANMNVDGSPPALLTPIPLDTAYSPANGRQQVFSHRYLHADLLQCEAPDIDEEGLRAQLTHALKGALNPREQALLALRFGLDGGEGRTLEQVGREMSITRERVRQIEMRALRRLRHPRWSRPLAAFLSDSDPLLSPWDDFWQTARGRSFGTYQSRAERGLAELEGRKPPPDGWTEEDLIHRAEQIAEMTEHVKSVLEREVTERPRGDILLRGATGAIRLTDVRLRAVSEFRRELTAHRPAPELPSVSPDWRPERRVEWWAIRAVRAWMESGAAPPPQGFSQRRALLRELTLQSALAVVQLCGFTVHDRRLDDRALWIHDPGLRLRLHSLAELGLRFRPSAYRYGGEWVRAWWLK